MSIPINQPKNSMETLNKVSVDQANEVAHEILNQLGGAGRLRAMISAHNFISHQDKMGGLSFRFKGSTKANYCKIILNGNDYYDIELGKVHGLRYTVQDKSEDMDSDQMYEHFQKFTGLTLTL